MASSSDDEPDNLTPIPPKEKEKEKEKDKGEETEREEEKQKEEGEDDEGPDLRPLGEVIKKSGRGRGEKKHYAAFELDGNRYQLVSTPATSISYPHRNSM